MYILMFEYVLIHIPNRYIFQNLFLYLEMSRRVHSKMLTVVLLGSRFIDDYLFIYFASLYMLKFLE